MSEHTLKTKWTHFKCHKIKVIAIAYWESVKLMIFSIEWIFHARWWSLDTLPNMLHPIFHVRMSTSERRSVNHNSNLIKVVTPFWLGGELLFCCVYIGTFPLWSIGPSSYMEFPNAYKSVSKLYQRCNYSVNNHYHCTLCYHLRQNIYISVCYKFWRVVSWSLPLFFSFFFHSPRHWDLCWSGFTGAAIGGVADLSSFTIPSHW